LAASPTSLSSSVKATYEGVIRFPARRLSAESSGFQSSWCGS
jgi:hypothetical protein